MSNLTHYLVAGQVSTPDTDRREQRAYAVYAETSDAAREMVTATWRERGFMPMGEPTVGKVV